MLLQLTNLITSLGMDKFIAFFLWAFAQFLCPAKANNSDAQDQYNFYRFNSSDPSHGPPLLVLGPVLYPGLDRASKSHLVPASSHNTSYRPLPLQLHREVFNPDGSPVAARSFSPPLDSLSASQNRGSANSTFSFKHPAVILENIASILAVVCSASEDSLTVTFTTEDAMLEALREWEKHSIFVLVTKHGNYCDSGTEQGYFLATRVTQSPIGSSLVLAARKSDMKSVVSNIQMSFSSARTPNPDGFKQGRRDVGDANEIAQRPVISPSMEMTYDQELPPNTTLLAWPEFIRVVSNTAYITSTLEFSGYLDYNMDNMTVNELYVDVDCNYEAAFKVTASVLQEFQKTTDLALIRANNIPEINIPNVVRIAPVLAFAVKADMAAKSAFEASSAYKMQIPNGNVHLDILSPGNNSLGGFAPEYSVQANATEDVPAHFNISTSLDVGLALKVGNLISFDCGFNITTKVNNVIGISAKQGLQIGDGIDIGDEPTTTSGTSSSALVSMVSTTATPATPTQLEPESETSTSSLNTGASANCGQNKVKLYSEFVVDFAMNNLSLFRETKVLLDVCEDLWGGEGGQ
ncbi:hypothetical protein CFIMG_006990RA [Ceratocystis fimbriata CBS 114723]|uniref:DUF7029 domain-containing protein n=1 Tax=Ceratocystis fimbriata CBS 114723 TaxID=1035309 RepID=A0A2C5WU72_9PEZI|nr:hypothetical protein CFIMG_006990RA [Ceratocystis fimbriata CBS 114723]